MKKSINNFFKKHPRLSVIAIALVFGFVQVAFSFCSDIICPAFADNNFDQWFPYKKGQVNIFSNGTQKDTITIGEVNRSEETRRPGGYGSGGGCHASITITSAEIDVTNRYHLAIDGFSKNYFIRLFDFYVDNLATNDSGFVTPPSSAGYHNQFRFEYPRNINFNNKFYAKMEIISRDTFTIKSTGIYKIWLAPNSGIIAYEEYPGLTQWIKQ